jgi:UDPglucose 6-dehydrogenase
MFNSGKKKKIAVVGCGKLGTPLVACLADAGYQVLGVDTNPNLIDELSLGKVSWNEPNLEPILKKNLSKIQFKNNENIEYAELDATFIIVPTPSQPDGNFSNEYVLNAVKKIGSSFKESLSKTHLIVIVSTVMPGSTSGVILNALNESVGTLSHSIRICYSPEFIALGSVIKNMRYPDMVLIGESDKSSGDLLEEISRKLVKNNPKFHRMSTVEAEIAKISINSYVTTKISFSNQISEVCQQIVGASADKVLNAIGDDSRIGRNYLKAATAFGGPCFPRDNRAFATFAENIGVSALIAEATDSINLRQNERLMHLVQKSLPQGSMIVIVGASYKPDTNVIEESPGVKFGKAARANGFIISFVDDYVTSIPELGGVEICTALNSRALVRKTDAVILFVPSNEYTNILQDLDSDKKVYDLWGIWSSFRSKFGSNYLRLGEFSGF